MPAPYLLLPYQQRWIADQSPIKVCEKSRRIGLSWAEAADDALLASGDGRNGSDVYYIGYNEDMARVWMEDVAWWAKNYELAASELEKIIIEDQDKDILAFQIRFASGHKVTALSSRPNNLRGKQGKIVIDEAAFHPDLAELLKAAIAMIMWGGKIVIISTHDGVDNPFNQLVNDVLAKKKDYSLHKITLDQALSDGLYKRICLVEGKEWSPAAEEKWRQELFDAYGDAANEELLCVPRAGGEIYFTSALVMSCMVEHFSVVRLKLNNDFATQSETERRKFVQDWLTDYIEPLISQLNPYLRTYYGMDFGRTNDLTVIAPVVETQKLHRECPFIVELRNVPIRQQEQILYYIVDRLPNFTAGAMDGRGNGQAIAEFAQQRYGSRIEAVMLSPDKYRDLVPKYKTALEDRYFTMPKDSDIVADHRSVRLENGVPKIPDTGRFKGSDGSRRHGDAFIALIMANHAATSNAGVARADMSSSNPQTNRNAMRNVFPISDRINRLSRAEIRSNF